MTNITVQTIDSIFVVDSFLLASELGIEHDSLKKNIKIYKADFEEFGNLSTDSRGVIGTSSYTSFYYLNEDQCYLALTYSNNTQQVRQAKLSLIKAFKLAREANIPKPNTDILFLLEQSAAAIREARALASAAEEKVAELEPKAEIFDVIANSGKLLSFSDAAKIINAPKLGRNNLMQLLRDKGVLQLTGNSPYQKYVSQGYFELIETDTNVGVKVVTKITQRGLAFIIRLLKKEGHEVPSKAA